MDFTKLWLMLHGAPGADYPKGGISTHPKDPRAVDFIDAIKRGMSRPRRSNDDMAPLEGSRSAGYIPPRPPDNWTGTGYTLPGAPGSITPKGLQPNWQPTGEPIPPPRKKK